MARSDTVRIGWLPEKLCYGLSEFARSVSVIAMVFQGDEVVKRRRILIIVVVQVASAIRPAGALVAGLAYLDSYGGVGPSGPT